MTPVAPRRVLVEAYRPLWFDVVELGAQLDCDSWAALVVEPAGTRFGYVGASVVVTRGMLARAKAVIS